MRTISIIFMFFITFPFSIVCLIAVYWFRVCHDDELKSVRELNETMTQLAATMKSIDDREKVKGVIANERTQN